MQFSVGFLWSTDKNNDACIVVIIRSLGWTNSLVALETSEWGQIRKLVQGWLYCKIITNYGWQSDDGGYKVQIMSELCKLSKVHEVEQALFTTILDFFNVTTWRGLRGWGKWAIFNLWQFVSIMFDWSCLVSKAPNLTYHRVISCIKDADQMINKVMTFSHHS